MYGSWAGTRNKPPKIKNAKQRALLFIRNTNGPGGRWVARRPASGAAPPRLTPPPAPVVAPAPGTNAGYTGPYAEYPEWARRVLQGIDTDFANHSRYVGFNTDGTPTGSGVASWLKTAMEGVNSMAGGMLGQYQANAGNVADTVAQAAGATPMQVNSPLAGGIVSSPQAYDYIGRSQGMAAQGQAIRSEADAYATQSRTNLGLASQGYLNSLADYARGLPAVYAEKRRGAREEIDKFLAEAEGEAQQLALDAAKAEETARSNRADEAIRTLNARNGLITALVNSGIKIDANTMRAIDIAADNAARDRRDARPSGVDPSQPVPEGYVLVKNADGSYEYKVDKTYSRPSTTGGGGGTVKAAQLRKEGFRGGWKVKPKKLPAGWTMPVQGDDGRWYAKPPGSGGGGGASTPGVGSPSPQTTTFIAEKFRSAYGPSGTLNDTSIVAKYDGNPAALGRAAAAWVLGKRNWFVDKNGKVNTQKIRAVLQQVMGAGGAQSAAWALISREIAGGKWKAS